MDDIFLKTLDPYGFVKKFLESSSLVENPREETTSRRAIKNECYQQSCKVPPEVVSNERLTFQEPSSTEPSENDMKVPSEDVLLREWVVNVLMGIDAADIFCQR
ncbi:hypothetical protein HAX54_035904 [Datura stramonium]|uniref:Uncharacterized protein n=1 Tax=Datura stramonium TaxID=4076 RepID=A0ABS8SG07_DATST|nr:hypothetical protein [Datura stramonium]